MMFGLVSFLMNTLLPDIKHASVSLLSKMLRFYQKLGVGMLLKGLLYIWLREQKYRGEKRYGMKNRWKDGRDGGKENGKELVGMHIATTIYKDVNCGFYILVFNSLAFCQELIVTHTHTHTHTHTERLFNRTDSPGC